MKKYHKIQSLYLRDPSTKFKTFLPEYSMPEFEYLKNLEWEWTEKVDGTNTRVYFDGKRISFGGRTDDSQIPTFLLRRLEKLFNLQSMKELQGLTLFGEGYGNKIQKVGKFYNPNESDFILFDIQTDDGIWLERKDVEDIAKKLNIQAVPIVGEGTLAEAENVVKNTYLSLVSKEKLTAEGLVLRPKQELLTREGKRIITKIKSKDFIK